MRARAHCFSVSAVALAIAFAAPALANQITAITAPTPVPSNLGMLLMAGGFLALREIFRTRLPKAAA